MVSFDIIFKNATLVNHDGEFPGDIGVRDGKIAAIGALEVNSIAGETIDCTGLHILPGFIDSQVHFREPGLEHKENLETGSLGAVMGGVTAVFEMPNTNPLTINEAAFYDKIARASNSMHCDFAFYIGGTHENTDQLSRLETLPGCAGIKVFMGSSTGSLLVQDDDGVRAILNAISRRAAFHSEDEYLLEEQKHLRVENDPASHPVWRDVEVALRSTK
ncbi:Dihydroorotase, partial [hydrothermal vent metagenome]